MRKTVALLVLVAVGGLAFLAWFLLRGDAPAPRVVRAGVEDLRSPPPVSGTPPRGSEAPRRDPSPAPIKPIPFVETESAPALVASTDPEALRVLVVEHGTGFPVPGAEVVWGDPASEAMPGPEGLYSQPPPLLAEFERAGHRTTADAAGIAIIRTRDGLRVAARLGDAFGFREFATAPRGEIRLPVRSGPMVAARVVTASGSPAPGVLVRFSLIRRRGKSSRATMFNAVSRSPDGIAIASHPGVDPDQPATEGFEVEAAIEGAAPKEAVKVASERLKEGPITLVLPVAGRVTVKVLDPGGKPAQGLVRVSLAAARRPPASGPTLLRVTAEAGTATFPVVPVNAPLKLSAEAADFDSVVDQQVGELLTPGGDLTVEVRFLTRKAVVSGRAVDEHGAPLGNRSIRIDVTVIGRASGSDAPDRIATDRAGSFRFPLDRGRFGDGGCTLMMETRSGPDDVVERSASVSVARLLDADATPLGDLRFVPPEPLASGIVIDELGEPIGGALVAVSELRMLSQRERKVMAGRRGVSFDKDRLRTRSDSAGTFTIPAPSGVRESVWVFGVRADLDGYVCMEHPIGQRLGATGLRIVLQGAGSIEGALLLPDPAPVRRIEIAIARPVASGGAPIRQRFEDSVDSEGRFRLTGVLPGTVNFQIRLAGQGEPLVSFQDVEVRRIAVTRDPRLAAVDLRDHPALRR